MTNKELEYINDIFNYNNTIINKLNLYLTHLEDSSLIKEFTSLKDMHLNICEELINYLEGEIK